MKHVGLITVNYNGARDIIDCVHSLEEVLLHDIQLDIYIIDNHSTDDSIQVLKSFLHTYAKKKFTIHLILSSENTGFSGGNNLGIQKAIMDGCTYLILLNSDTVVEKHLIEELVSAADQHSHVGIIVPKIYFAPGYEFHKAKYTDQEKGRVIWYAGGKMDWKNIIGSHIGVDEVDRGQFDTSSLTETATGCCMLLKTSTIEQVGTLDEAYFMYYEDADYSMKVKKNNLGILFWPKAKVWHKNASSSGGSGSPLQEYYITRNRLLFGFRFATLRTKFALFRESFRLLLQGTVWQKKGIIDFYTGRLGRGRYAKK